MLANRKLKKTDNILIQHKGDGTADCFMGASFLGNKTFPFAIDINTNQGAVEIFDSSGIEFEIQSDSRKFKVLPGGIPLTPVESNSKQLVLSCVDTPAAGTFMSIGIYQSPQTKTYSPQNRAALLQSTQVKLLAPILNINNSRLIASDVNPTVIPYDAHAGELMMSIGNLYCKLDDGLTTNWRDISRDYVTTNLDAITSISLSNLQDNETLMFDSYWNKWMNSPYTNFVKKTEITEPFQGDLFFDEILVKVKPYMGLWNKPHKATRWQLSYTPTFDSLVLDEVSTTDLLVHTFHVSGNYEAFIRVQFINEDDQLSEFSSSVQIEVVPTYVLQPNLTIVQLTPSYNLIAENEITSWTVATEIQKATQLFISNTGAIGDYTYKIGERVIDHSETATPTIQVFQLTKSNKMIATNTTVSWNDSTELQKATQLYITSTGTKGEYSYDIGETEIRTIAPESLGDFDSATTAQKIFFSFIGDEDGKLDGYVYNIGK